MTPPWVDPDPAATRAALARLRAHLAALPPATPADWQREGIPLAVYGEAPRLAIGPAPPVPAGCGWDDPADRPGPQPWNAGITPGWPPDPPPPPELAAAVGELAHAARVAERVGAAARKASGENWELARTVAELEARVAELEHEIEVRRGTDGRGACEGRPGRSRPADPGPAAG